MDKEFKRAHLRAPLITDALYILDEFVLKANLLNISEGGILVDNLPRVPEIAAIPLMFPLIDYPEFSQLHADILLALNIQQLEKRVIRTKARIVRSFEGQSDVDKIFITKIGCQFVVCSDEDRELISQYVSRYGKNLIYYLGLFEGRGQKSGNLDVLRKVADLLGYDSTMQIGMLRLKALHDYQSLESL